MKPRQRYSNAMKNHWFRTKGMANVGLLLIHHSLTQENVPHIRLYMQRSDFAAAAKHRTMSKQYPLIIALLFLITLPVFAQPAIQWQRCLGGAHSDFGYAIEPTTDGSYIVAAQTYSANADVTFYRDSGDAWIIKLDKDGSTLWQKTYGGTGHDVAADIKPANDGGFIFTGTTTSVNNDIHHKNGAADLWIVKLDSLGTIMWSKTYGGSGVENGYKIIPVIGGGYLIAGDTYSVDGDVTGNHGSYGSVDVWLVKINDTGKLLWQKTYGGSADEFMYGLRQSADTGFIMAGYTSSTDGQITNSHGGGDLWVIKLNDTGKISWQKSFGGTLSENASDIRQTLDGGYIISCSSFSNNGQVTGHHDSMSTNSDYWIVRLDDTGRVMWETSYGGSRNDYPSSIYQTDDSGYLVSGYTFSSDFDVSHLHSTIGDGDAWIMKLTKNGQIAWQSTYGGTSDQKAVKVLPGTEGGYIVGGTTRSDDGDCSGLHGDPGISDVWIIKLSFTVGLEQPNDNSPITLYPTITKGDVHVSGLKSGTNPKIHVLNMLGASMPFEIPPTNAAPTFNLANLPDGIYLVEIEENSRSSHFKILVQH